MIINGENLALAFKGFKALYTEQFEATVANYDKIAMTVPSQGRDTTYAWLGQFPQMREWVDGPRQLKALEAHGFSITNVKFESTVKISRDDFSDDQYGAFGKMFAEMGLLARKHPDELVFSLLGQGFTETCYDGQYFFDTDHPFQPDPAGAVTSVSNMQAGTGPAWFLLDASRPLKPIIWQEREKYDLQTINRHDDPHVFMNDEYLYGVRARVNAGFGLWQLAFGSKAALTPANYKAARATMQTYRGDRGRILGVMPNVLVVPPVLEEEARAIVSSALTDTGGTNPWAGTAEVIVSPFLA
jgi:phage major head subunit gpT-like protein